MPANFPIYTHTEAPVIAVSFFRRRRRRRIINRIQSKFRKPLLLLLLPYRENDSNIYDILM
jgi:hypothetical protein